MPYIKEENRRILAYNIDAAEPYSAENPGELNYLFTVISKEYVDSMGESYQTYNDIIGALECCKLELYRRKTSLYEDKKIKENGDVW